MQDQNELGWHRQEQCVPRPEQSEGINDAHWASMNKKDERITWEEIYNILFPTIEIQIALNVSHPDS